MSKTHEISEVTIHLGEPDQLKDRWVGQEELVKEL